MDFVLSQPLKSMVSKYVDSLHAECTRLLLSRFMCISVDQLVAQYFTCTNRPNGSSKAIRRFRQTKMTRTLILVAFFAQAISISALQCTQGVQSTVVCVHHLARRTCV